jgi:IS4 transposase
MPMVSGDTDGEGLVFKYATLTIVGRNIPFILEVEPVRESSSWDENPSNRIHRTVRRLIQRAREHVNIEMVLCDAEFDSKHVFQTLSNLNVDYLIPTRVNGPEKEAIERMNDDGQEVAVEKSSVHLKNGSHSMRFLYVPSKNSDGTSVFATNVDVGPAEAKSLSRRYSSRWQIESEYKSIKHEFLAKTSSKDYRVRLFYFVFGALLHNIWRMTDFLLKAEVGGIEDGVFDRPPVLTAGETTELVSSALLPYG